MKITKKFLIVFFTCVLLAATVFATVASALKAGETTTVEEYRTMFKVGEDDFEKGSPTTFKGAVTNGASTLTTGVEYWSRYRESTAGIYAGDDEYSDYFYTFDYNHNYGGPQNNSSHVYIQPSLGVLNNIEKTPANGFVTEFDIAFWSPLINVTVPAVDENGEPVMVPARDEFGQIIYQDVYYAVGETELEVSYVGGYPQLDSDGKVMLVEKKDAQGNPVKVTAANTVKKIEVVYDEDGKYVMEGNLVKTQVQKTPRLTQGRTNVTEPKLQRVRNAMGDIVWCNIYEGDVIVAKEPKIDVIWEDVVDSKFNVMTYGQLGITEIEVPKKDPITGQLLYHYENKTFDGVTAEILVVEMETKSVSPNETAKRMVTTDVFVKGAPEDFKYRDAFYDDAGNLVVKEGKATFKIDMYNTYTYKDGDVSLLEFTTDAASGTVSVKINDKANIDKTTKPKTFKYDEWTHFAIQFVAETQTVYIYIGDDTGDGRVLLGQAIATDKIENKGNAVGPVYPLALRIGTSGGQASDGNYQTYATKGVVSLDNLLSYQGVTLHNPDMITDIEAKDPHGLFKYLMTVLENESGTNSAVSRYYAFKDADQDDFIATYYKDGKATSVTLNDEGLQKALTVYLAYKTGFSDKLDENGKPVVDSENNIIKVPNTLYADLFKVVCDENAATFANYVEKVKATDRTLANVAERTAKIGVAESFLSDVSKEISTESETFKQANADLAIAKAAVESDTASNEFIKYIDLFKASIKYEGASVERIKHHYENAGLYFDKISDYSGSEAKPLAAADRTKLANAVKVYVGDASNPSAGDIVNSSTNLWNSQRFVKIMALITERGYDFAADDGTTENLWHIAFDIIRSGEYDATVEGFNSALVVYDNAYTFFWQKMQNEHIAIITAKLDSFNNVNSSFIDKKGICQYVNQYWATNLANGDIDENNATLKALMERNRTYERQLTDTLEGDYERLLSQNTVKFVNTINLMSEYTAYADIKPYYDEATEYYYSMNLVYDEDGDGKNDVDIDSAIAKYEQTRALLANIEEDCSVFIANAELIGKADTKAKLYSALVGCYDSMTYLDDTYEGIVDAKAKYEQAYADYTNVAKTVSSHIAEANEIVCSSRGNWSIDSIVAFVRQYFN